MVPIRKMVQTATYWAFLSKMIWLLIVNKMLSKASIYSKHKKSRKHSACGLRRMHPKMLPPKLGTRTEGVPEEQEKFVTLRQI
ncbi:hypothetical protein CUU64_00685 [Bacillus sp. V5-8f]|nr:hypothetical protein CUU64_00685 [Bacillus sp. V5-8f]